MARKSRTTPIIEQPKEQEIYSDETYKVALYLRLSDEDRNDEEQNSIGNQRKICLDYIENHDNMEFANQFVDNGFSGANFNRPAFKEMITGAENGLFNCIIVKDLSRFGRNFIEVSEYLEITFTKMNIRFIAVNNEYDSDDDKNKSDMAVAITNIVNDFYVKDISKKIRSAIDVQMEQGIFMPSISSMPYGYEKDTENNTYLVDESVREIIVNIFKMRAEGKKYNDIARVLNDYNVPSPGKLRFLKGYTKDKRFENAIWIRSTLRSMLSNPVYLGHRVYGKVKRDGIGLPKTRRDKDEWKIIENTHEPIISQELFDKVTRINEQELTRLENYTKREAPLFDFRPILKDKLYCGDCGNKMLGQKFVQRERTKAPNFVFFECSEYLRTDRKSCKKHYIHASLIMDKIAIAITKQAEIAISMQEMLNTAKEKHSKNTKSISKSLYLIEQKKRSNKLFCAKLLQDQMDGLLDVEEYKFAKSKYESEYNLLLTEEEQLKASNDKEKQVILDASSYFSMLLKFDDITKIDRELIEALVLRVNIFENNAVEIVLNYKNIFEQIMAICSNTGEAHAG